MVIEMCKCNHGIPGVEELPWHLHRSYVRAEIIGDDHPNKGMIITLPLHDWNLNFDNDSVKFRQVEVVRDEVSFHVNWKEVFRGLCRGVEAIPG